MMQERHRVVRQSTVSSSSILLGALTTLLLVFGGCGVSSKLPESTYAEPDGWNGKNSVAGSSVFKRMLTNRGYNVYKLKGLSRRAKRLQTIIWFPTDLGVPSQATCDWIDNWLAEDPDRLFIYFGRDCNPGEDYWNAAVRQASPSDAIEFRNRAALEKADLDVQRQKLNGILYCPWFMVDSRQPRTSITSWRTSDDDIDFMPPASPLDVVTRYASLEAFAEDDVRASIQQVELNFESVRTTMESYVLQPLLTSSDGIPFLSQVTNVSRYSGRIYVVANAGPVLNLGLTRAENRDFANSLIDWIPRGSIGILLASHKVSSLNSDETEMESFGMFRTWPINLVSYHIAILGILLAIAYFPIFGRPRRLPDVSTQDFGEHVRALGDAMRSTGDRKSALHFIAHYFRTVRGDLHDPWSNADLSPVEPLNTVTMSNHSQHSDQEKTS